MEPDGTAAAELPKELQLPPAHVEPSRPEGDVGVVEVARDEESEANAAENVTALETLNTGWDGTDSHHQAKSRDWRSYDIVNDAYVSKIVPERAYTLTMHPSSDTVAVWAGDKGGRLGVWLAPSDLSLEEEEYEANFTVFQPHSRPITGLAVPPGKPSNVVTCSYDTSLRSLDCGAQIFREVFVHDDFLSCCCTVPGSPDTILAGSSSGEIIVIDSRVKQGGPRVVDAHDKKLNTIDAHVGGNLIVSASNDTTVCLWDMRKLATAKKPTAVATLPHGRSIGSAVFAPNSGSRLVTTCADDFLYVYDDPASLKGAAVKPTRRIAHNNHTGRWITKFRTEFDPADDTTVVVGSMQKGAPRQVDVFNVANGKRRAALRKERMTAIASLNVVHPTLPVFASVTGSGRVHLWTPGGEEKEEGSGGGKE
jgi:WD40 repeat protein